MSIQETLQIAGIASFVMAGLLAALSVHAFVREDIPSVLSDLSGRSRRRALATASTAQTGPLAHRGAQELPSVAYAAEHNVETEIVSVPTHVSAPAPRVPFELAYDIVLCPVRVQTTDEGEIL